MLWRIWLKSIKGLFLILIVLPKICFLFIEVLDLWQVDVSDEGLLALSELTNLDRLSVLETKVTVDGVAEFKTALPECEVVSDAR